MYLNNNPHIIDKIHELNGNVRQTQCENLQIKLMLRMQQITERCFHIGKSSKPSGYSLKCHFVNRIVIVKPIKIICEHKKC